MASERRTCKRCKTRFSRSLGSRRIYCETCRPPRAKAESPGPSQDQDRPPGELEIAVRAELDRVGRLTTWQGLAAARLARECDAATGSQVSSLAKQLDVAMKAAMDGVPPKPDFVDELAERRRSRTA